MKTTTLAIIAVTFCSFSIAHAAPVTFDWATVGNPGNADDTHGAGYGSVAYTYRISKTEVTNAQYTVFLNAVATADPNGLYNPDMWLNTFGSKIQRSGTSGSYTYSVATERANRPVNFVSYLDAMRFTNWLENGQPTGAQGPGTTEDGVYAISDGLSEVRNSSATYFLPSEDEWYKAAYYDPVAGVYYDYPTGTDSLPSNDLFISDPGNNANFRQGSYTIGSPYWMTEVGSFGNSESPYGTFDQGGNVWEWNETLVSSSRRGVRGGGWFLYSSSLRAVNRSNDFPTEEDNNIGFRVASIVASIPEPGSMTLAVSMGVVVLMRRRRVS